MGLTTPSPGWRIIGDMADDGLAELYAVAPEGFTALRTKLAAEAKRQGDTAASKRISASRKPTTAAWIANLLAIKDQAARQLAAAERALVEADESLSVQQGDVVEAGLRRDTARRHLDDAERALEDAENSLAVAEEARRAADAVLDEARARLERIQADRQ